MQPSGLLHLFLKLDKADRIGRFEPADWPAAVGCRQYLAGTVEHEIRRLNKLPTILPPRPKLIGLRSCDAIGDRKRNLVRDFLCFFHRLRGRCDDLGSQFFESFQLLTETAQLTETVRSERPPVKQHDQVFG